MGIHTVPVKADEDDFNFPVPERPVRCDPVDMDNSA